MKVLFVAQVFPASLGALARELARQEGWECEFLCRHAAEPGGEVRLVEYERDQEVSADTHFLARPFEDQVLEAESIYRGARDGCRLQPDIVVNHAGASCALLLRELYGCPMLTYFDSFHRTPAGPSPFRFEHTLSEAGRLRLKTLNAMLLVELAACDAGFTATHYQHTLIPREFAHKVRVCYDGCDIRVFDRRPDAPRIVGGKAVPADTRIVTFAAGRLDAESGFDLFMQAARVIEQRYSDVLFVVCGHEVPGRGPNGEERPSYMQQVLRRGRFDLSRFMFLPIPGRDLLANLWSIADVHVHLAVPGPVSRSLINAMACGVVVIGSDTAPVREFIRHRQNGLLAGFYDPMTVADEAVRVLSRPGEHRSLGAQARKLVRENLSIEAVLPQFAELMRSAGKGLPDQFAEARVEAQFD